MKLEWLDIWMGVLLCAALLIAIGRFTLPVSGINPADIYKDLAHVFVGTVLGLAIATRMKMCWIIFAFLCAVELIAVFVRR